MLSAFASGFLVFAFLATALFQLAIVLGAPLGQYAYGGQHQGKLPIGYRLGSVVSFFLMLAFAGHYVAQLGLVPQLLGQAGNQVTNWILVGFGALSALMNNITKSQKEKRLWGGTTIAMLLASILVALDF
jgi:hypothetical protein